MLSSVTGFEALNIALFRKIDFGKVDEDMAGSLFMQCSPLGVGACLAQSSTYMEILPSNGQIPQFSKDIQDMWCWL